VLPIYQNAIAFTKYKAGRCRCLTLGWEDGKAASGLARNGSGPTTQESSFWALRGISFDVARGEVVGLIGHNGAGKSTLLKILSRITEPTSGEALLHGRVGSLLEVGTGFHQELTGRENIYLSGAILGMRSDEINQAFDEIVDFAGVEEFLDMPVKRYSSGMKVRLGFAVAAHLRPEILLVDEVLAVGDAQFQKKCLAKMGDIVKGGRSILFVTHNMLAIQSLCERVIWLDSGAMVQDGPTDVVITQYLKSQGSGLMEQSWDDVESAPGNDKVRLHRACVRADIDPPPEVFTIRTPLPEPRL
jgi:lipopolysaccharide transport system ATP-binding protein